MTTSWKTVSAAAVFALICLTACGTLNRGTTADPDRGPVIGDVLVVPPHYLVESNIVSITVNWSQGVAPYTIQIDTGSEDCIPAGTPAGDSPYEWEFSIDYEGFHEWSVTITDYLGRSATETGSYFVEMGEDFQPTILDTDFNPETGELTVTIADAEGSDIYVSLTEIEGLSVDRTEAQLDGGNGDVVFKWSAQNALLGGEGTTTISVTDFHFGSPDTEEVVITIPPIELDLNEGRLAVVPLEISAAVGDTVTIMVATGSFPATAPFAYMNGVGVTVTDGGDYVYGTFNVGAIGGQTKDVDGIWAEMDPRPSTFFIPEDFMMRATDLTADSSFDFMGFNLTPIGAGEVTCGGILFNFGMSFDAAGTYELGILEFQDVKRTYYSDCNTTEYYWTDITNDLAIPTTITVN